MFTPKIIVNWHEMIVIQTPLANFHLQIFHHADIIHLSEQLKRIRNLLFSNTIFPFLFEKIHRVRNVKLHCSDSLYILEITVRNFENMYSLERVKYVVYLSNMEVLFRTKRIWANQLGWSGVHDLTSPPNYVVKVITLLELIKEINPWMYENTRNERYVTQVR